MKRTIQFLFACIPLFFLFSPGCNKAPAASSEYPEIQVRFKGKGINTPFRLSDMIDSVKRITISDDVLIEQPTSIKYCNDLYYLVDAKTHSLVIINEDGDIVGHISRRGRARDEYTALFDFDVNPRTGEISIYDQPGNKMIVYSSAGEYIRSFKMRVYDDFAVMDNGDYICYYPLNEVDTTVHGGGLWLLDSIGNHKKQLLSIDEDYRFYIHRLHGYFCRLSNGSVRLLGVEDTDCVYDIDSLGNIRIAYQLRYMPQMSVLTRNTEPTPKSSKDNYSYMKYWYAEADHWLIIESASNNPAGMSFVFYDKVNNKEYLCINTSDIIVDVVAEVVDGTAAPDRLIGKHYPENSESLNPEIVVAYLK